MDCYFNFEEVAIDFLDSIILIGEVIHLNLIGIYFNQQSLFPIRVLN